MVFEKLKAVIAGVLKVDPEEITPESTFVQDLGADSLDLYQILTRVEDIFGIVIERQEAEHLVTAGDAAELIQRVTAREGNRKQ